jgi:hypothetical protein
MSNDWSPVVVLLPPGQRLSIGARVRLVRLAWTMRVTGRWPSPAACVRVLLLGKTGDLG